MNTQLGCFESTSEKPLDFLSAPHCPFLKQQRHLIYVDSEGQVEGVIMCDTRSSTLWYFHLLENKPIFSD